MLHEEVLISIYVRIHFYIQLSSLMNFLYFLQYCTKQPTPLGRPKLFEKKWVEIFYLRKGDRRQISKWLAAAKKKSTVPRSRSCLTIKLFHIPTVNWTLCLNKNVIYYRSTLIIFVLPDSNEIWPVFSKRIRWKVTRLTSKLSDFNLWGINKWRRPGENNTKLTMIEVTSTHFLRWCWPFTICCSFLLLLISYRQQISS